MSVFDGKCQYDNKIHCALNLGCERCKHNPTYIHEQKKKTDVVVEPRKKVDFLAEARVVDKRKKRTKEEMKELREKIKALYAKGCNHEEIADECQLEERYVAYIAAEMGLRSKKNRRRTNEQKSNNIKKAQELKTKGLSVAEIAKELDLSKATVRNDLKKKG